ncbi:MAG TPA: amidase [Gemmatimonadaceae bacterium]
MHDPFLQAVDLAEAIRRRRVSPLEVIDATLERITRLNPELNAYLAVFDESARAAAARLMRRRGGAGALSGVPVSVKDLICTVDGLTTGGSRIFGDGVAARHDAPVIRRLRRAGAIVIGKTNLHEVALGVTTVNEHFGASRNPWNRATMAGGSSGGSAVAVAAGLGPLSVGTDTRGSIRIPAACCGITGLKPTYGLVPVDGVLPLSPTLDHVGPMARSAADCALMLGVMASGRDPLRYLRTARRPWAKPRVGVSEFLLRDLDGEVQPVVDQALKQLQRLGAQLRDVSHPAIEEAEQASVCITGPEAFAYHERALRETPEGFGPLVRSRLAAGGERRAVEYLRALEARQRVIAALAEVFGEVDVLVGATLPVTAPPIETLTLRLGGREATVVEAFTRFNSPFNMAGVPALSVPCGLTSRGMPVGLQIVAPRGADASALRLGMVWQRATDWHRVHPTDLDPGA